MKGAGVLRTNADFRRYWLSSTLSTLGSQLSLLAFPLLVLSIGGSAAQAGTVATCSLVSRTLLRLPAGQLADRFDRRMIMVGTDLVRLVALASIPLVSALGDLGQAHLLGVAVVEGAATALFAPAASIAVRDVVPEKDLTDALSRSQAAMATGSLIGPFLGGWLYTLDPILPFAADALSYGVSAVLLLRIATRPRRQAAGAERDNRLTAGLRWLTHQRPLLAALLFAAGINVVSAAAQTTMVVSLRESGTGGTTIGAVMACAGIGGMLGAAAAPRLIKRVPAARLFLLIGAVWAIGLTVFSATTQPWSIGPVLVVVVFFSPPAGIVVGRAMLVLAPRDLLGRVSTATGLVMAGLASLGPVLAGSFVDSLGAAHTWLALAGTAAVVTVVSSVPLLRETSIDAVTDDVRKPGPARVPNEPRPADASASSAVADSPVSAGAGHTERPAVEAHGEPVPADNSDSTEPNPVPTDEPLSALTADLYPIPTADPRPAPVDNSRSAQPNPVPLDNSRSADPHSTSPARRPSADGGV